MMQMIDFLTLLNVNQPQNLGGFLQTMSEAQIQLLPNFFGFMSHDRCKVGKEKFEEEEMTCHIFNNTGTFMAYALVMFLAQMVGVLVLKLCFKSKEKLKKSKVGKIFKGLVDSMGLLFWVEYFESVQLDIYFTCFITMSKMFSKESKDIVSLLNFVISLIIFAVSIALVSWLFYLICKVEALKQPEIVLDKAQIKNLKKFEKYGILSEDFKNKTPYQIYYKPISMLKEPLIALTTLAFYGQPPLQITSVTFVLGGFLIADLIHQPHKQSSTNYYEAIMNGLYTLCCGGFYLVSLAESKQWSRRTQYYFIGYPVILLIVAISLMNLGSGFYDTFQTLKGWFCKKKEETVKERRVSRSGQHSEILGLNQSRIESKKRTFDKLGKRNGQKKSVHNNPSIMRTFKGRGTMKSNNMNFMKEELPVSQNRYQSRNRKFSKLKELHSNREKAEKINIEQVPDEKKTNPNFKQKKESAFLKPKMGSIGRSWRPKKNNPMFSQLHRGSPKDGTGVEVIEKTERDHGPRR